MAKKKLKAKSKAAPKQFKAKAKPSAKKLVKAKAPAAAKAKKEPAFPFIIDEIMSTKIGGQITVKPMFGAHAIYRADQILFILRHKEDKTTERDNGMWVVSSGEDQAGLMAEFKALRGIQMFSDMKKGGGIGTWINLPEQSPSFESDAISLVELATRFDPRVGKIPGTKKKK